MKAIAITNQGLEDITKLEVKELLKIDAKTETSVALFDIKDITDLCKFCYKSQSIIKAGFLFSKFKIDSIKDIKGIKELNLKPWFDKETTFAVRCKKIDNELSTKEIEEIVGSQISSNLKQIKIPPRVNLDNPDIIFLIYIHKNNAYLLIDFSGFDLSKRDYKVFTHPSDMKGNIAYSLLRFADYKDRLLDPFCKSSTIPIESALYSSNLSPHFFRKTDFSFINLKPLKKTDFDKLFSKLDKTKKKKSKIFAYDSLLRNITAAKKNAKIANVNKTIKFSKINIEDLDLKFDKDIDLIATSPPSPTKFNQKEIQQIYHEFFYQAKLILSKSGKIVLISTKTDLLKQQAEKHNFKLVNEKKVMAGKQELYFLIFKQKI